MIINIPQDLKIKKNILVCLVPGDKLNNYVFKKLFDYSINPTKYLDKNSPSQFEYSYHILVHDVDKHAWVEKGATNSETKYNIYPYGLNESHDVNFDLDFYQPLESVRKDSIFGYTKYSKVFVQFFKQILESNLLDNIRKLNFDMLISDIPNLFTKFLKNQLKIQYNVYLSQLPLPNLFYNMFEINSSYLPAIATDFTDSMNFKERFINTIRAMTQRIMLWFDSREHSKIFKNYGFDVDSDMFINDSLVMIQYPKGFYYNLSLPPNFVRLNAITPISPIPVEEKIEKFLKNYSKTIYFSNDRIINNNELEIIIKVFQHFSRMNIGFIISIKTKQTTSEIIEKLPKNVFYAQTVNNSNDLLGDDRIYACITNGDINLILESVYHFKPLIVYGVSLDIITTATVVNKRDLGIVLPDSYDSFMFIQAIVKVLSPGNNYIVNCKKYGKLIRLNKDADKEFLFWINYIFIHGYDHLRVKSYAVYNEWQLYNYDVFVVYAFIIYMLYIFVKKICTCIFCSCKASSKIKQH